jgi:hypothetical protein
MLVVLGFSAHTQTMLFHENFDPPSGPDSTFNLTYNGVKVFRVNTSVSVSAPNCYYTNGIVSGFGTRPYFQTPAFSTHGNFKYLLLTFDNIAKTAFSSGCFVQYSINNGQTWSGMPAASYIGGATGPWYGYFDASSYPDWQVNNPTAVPDSSWWKKEVFDLTGLINNTSGPNPVGYSNVKIKFLGPVGGYHAGWFVDNLKVIGTNCLPVPPVLDTTYTPSFCYNPFHKGFTIAQPTNSYPIGIEAYKASALGSAVDSVTAYFQVKVNGVFTAPQNVKLQPQSGNADEYIGYINGIMPGDTVRYYLQAVDSCGNYSYLPSQQNGVDYRTFYVGDTVLSKCGTAPCGVNIINRFPWVEDFETPEWRPGSGSISNVNPPRGKFYDAPNQGWMVVPADNIGHGWSICRTHAGSLNSGPYGDSSPSGFGQMAYTSFTSGPVPDSTLLTTPCIDLTDTLVRLFTYDYHMYGADIENLRVDIDTGSQVSSWHIGVDELIGQQQSGRFDAWKTRSISLKPYRGKIIKIRFVSKRSTSGTLREVALDNLRIENLDRAEAGLVDLVTELTNPCGSASNVNLFVKAYSTGYDTLKAIPMAYQLDANPVVRDTVKGLNLAYLDTTNLILSPALTYNRSVAHTLRIWAELPGDTVGENDTLTVYVPVLNTGLINSFPHIMDFENLGVVNGVFQTGHPAWSISKTGLLGNWYTGKYSSNDFTSGPFYGHGREGQFLRGGNSSNFSDSLILSSGCIDLSNLNSPQLSFEYYLNQNVGLAVYIRHKGEPWQMLTHSFSHFPGLTSLKIKHLDLTAYSGKVVEIQIVVTNATHEVSFGIDNLEIGESDMKDISFSEVSRNVITHMEGVTKLTNVQVNYLVHGTPAARHADFKVEFINVCRPSAPRITGQQSFSTHSVALAPGFLFDSIVLSAPLPAGEYTLKMWLQMSGDTLAANDTMIVHSVVAGRYGAPYFNNFDGCEVLFRDSDVLDQWQVDTPQTGAHSGQSTYSTNAMMALAGIHFLYPPVFTGLDTLKGTELRFWHKYDFPDPTEYGRVQYFDGSVWKSLYSAAKPGLNNQVSYTGTSGWIQSIFNVDNAVLANGQLYLRFEAKLSGQPYGGWSIDDFEIYIPGQHSASPVSLAFTNALPKAGPNQVGIRVKNTGQQELSGALVRIKDQNGAVLLQEPVSFNPPLAYGSSQMVSLQNMLNISPSLRELWITTSNPNQRIDALPEDDTLKVSLKLPVPVDSVPYCTDFETDQDFLGMEARTNTLSNLWNYNTPLKSVISGAYSGSKSWYTNDTGHYPGMVDHYLYTPPIKVKRETCYRLDFWHWYDTELNFDGGNVEFTLDTGATWQILGHYGDSTWYNRQYVRALDGVKPGFTGHSAGWVYAMQTFQIRYAGNVQFRFRFAADAAGSGDGWAIDEVCLEEITNGCPTIDLPELPLAEDGFKIYPNPAGPTLNVVFEAKETSPKEDVSLSIYDSNGRPVKQWKQQIKAGVIYPVSLFDLPAGAYYMQGVLGNTVYTQPFIKLR